MGVTPLPPEEQLEVEVRPGSDPDTWYTGVLEAQLFVGSDGSWLGYVRYDAHGRTRRGWFPLSKLRQVHEGREFVSA